MNICHFSYSFFPLVGGMEEVIHNLCLEQIKAGDSPSVLTPWVRGKDNQCNVPYPVQRFNRPSSKRFLVSQMLIPLYLHYRRHSFDVLQCHGLQPAGTAARLFHKIFHVPLVIQSHGGDIEVGKDGTVATKRITAAIRRNFESADAVIAISKDMQKRMQRLGAPEKQVFCIPNGIQMDEFRESGPYSRRSNRKDPYVFYIGGLKKHKGVDLLFQAFSGLVSQFPNLQLKIAGSGKEEMNLKKLAETLGISSRVSFLGMVRGEIKKELLRNACVSVVPSRMEAFGVVVLEAMASGIPVVGANVGGIPDSIHSGENGLLFEKENADQLRECLCRVLDDPSLAGRLGEAAEKTAAAHDWPIIVSRYRQVYQQVLKEK